MTSFVVQNWGNVASVAGLAVSVWVLYVAKKAREAAEDARIAARLKNLVEVLEEAGRRSQQIGIFLRAEKWDLVQLRAEEILNSCKLIRSRWGEGLPERAVIDLDEAAKITKSIASVANDASMRQLKKQERRSIADAQMGLSELLSSILGVARKADEEGD